ncbi:hypothetical protein DMB38_22115 [Streptomyces sp. WAC 06738]|nr:hypothetical protein DMB38_22115 [Streptomyces sp. WAC 06738]
MRGTAGAAAGCGAVYGAGPGGAAAVPYRRFGGDRRSGTGGYRGPFGVVVHVLEDQARQVRLRPVTVRPPEYRRGV